MGYMKAHAIVVDSWNGDLIEAAHKTARDMFPWVSPISPKAMNGHRSFFVPPDGSKEGWADSALGDDKRKAFKKWLRAQRHEDGSTSLNWVEVMFGEDNGRAAVEDHDGASLEICQG